MRKIYILLILITTQFPPLFGQQDKEVVFELVNRQAFLHQDLNELTQEVNVGLRGNSIASAYIKFDRSPDKSSLEVKGIVLENNIQGNIYTATFSKKISGSDFINSGITGWSAVAKEDKINPYIFDNSQEISSQKEIIVAIAKKMGLPELNSVLADLHAQCLPQQLWKSQNMWQVKIQSDKITELAKYPFVLSITPNVKPTALDNEANGLTNNQITQQPLNVGGHDLHGSGVTIGVGDNSDPLHIDYADRIIPFNPTYDNDHAILTTGLVGGNGLVDERYKGCSNKATLVSDFFSQIISNASYYLQDFNMVISSNSYGNIVGSCSYAGTYDTYAQFVDQLMRDHPTQLHIFAAANDGRTTCAPFPPSYATITGSFASAKNTLTVGAITKKRIDLGIDPYSSKGPVKDGRIKPEIATIGDHLYSTIENNGYAENTGTSMACPNVAGGAGLLYERYRQLHSNQDPKSALIKTILMNGATDLGTEGPDFIYGFGALNTGHSVAMLDSNRIFSSTINTNNEQTYTFAIPANTFKTKVMLYWNDPAAMPLSSNTLINDLDLSVVSPSNVTTLPLVLNSSPANVANPATPQADHKNNVEQVTLLNPASGTYTIKVKGFNVPEINQEYFVVYDFIPNGITLQYPFGGEALIAGDSMYIYWEASDGTNPFTIAYSTNNGGSWTNIDNNVGATQRDYTWYIPGSISSNQCLVRITRNSTSEVSQSKPFTLTKRPVTTLNPTSEQCPGSIKISWNTIAGASSYQLFKKTGIDMVAVAVVTGNTYTFTGLGTDSTYWVAVAPIINGTIGMRSVALNRQPSDGNCVGTTSHGDLRMAKIIAPGSGRAFTATSLTANSPLTVLISNLDNQTANNYQISYKINNGAWTSVSYTDPITPAGNRLITVGNLNLAAVGSYDIVVAIRNLAMADPQLLNDTLKLTVRQIENAVIDLAGDYEEGFESTTNISLIGTSMIGLNSANKWDFTQSQINGRLKNFLSSEIVISGTKSMSMDNNNNQRLDIPGSSYNTLTGTFNLSNYDTGSSEVRCDFDYVMSGIPKFDTGNSVWFRGSESDPWIHLLNYQIDTVNPGAIFHSGSLQLSDKLAAAGQNFSSSTQIKFTQYDTSRIESTYFGNGVTMDNFKLYTVTDDISLLAIDSLYHYNCGLSAQVPLMVKVVNNVSNTVYDVRISYKLDNHPVITEILDSIQGNDTLVYTFSQTMDLSANTAFTLSTWVNAITDTYRLNDSIINFSIKNQPIITTFPYLENFDENEGYFYGEGTNSSWNYGTPASPKINHAASGLRAWKTNLTGNYNANEVSFLYSPCFNVSQMAHPTLSFHIAMDIEPPGNMIFDRGFVEYSYDGRNWQKLGAAGQGTNWYNNNSAQAWTVANQTYWHVATIPLPKDNDIVSFRFVLRSDQGTEYEGIAIDDIHIYDLVNPIFNQAQFTNPISQSVSANQTVNYIQGNDIGVSLLNGNSLLGNTSVQDYKHDSFINNDSTQYYVPKNFTIQTTNAPGDSVTVRFYIPDEAIQKLRSDVICSSCSKVWEVQSLGITKYDDPDKSVENNSLADNINGTYSFIPKNKIVWVPYDIGYYGETKVKSFSEFWFNDGGPTHDQILPANIFSFTAAHLGKRYAQLNWLSNIDASTKTYELQRADASLNFTTVATIRATGQNGSAYSYVDTPVLVNSATVFYRIKYTLLDSTKYTSVIRSLDWSGAAGNVIIYPNPVRNGILNLNWFKGTGDGLQWSIYNSVGKRITSGFTEQNTFDGNYQFDFSKMGIANGVYILNVVSGKEEWSFKIVFQ